RPYRDRIGIRSKHLINWADEKTTGTVPAGNFAARPSNTSRFQSQNQSQLLSSRASHFDGSRFRLDQNRGSGGHWLRNVKIAYCWFATTTAYHPARNAADRHPPMLPSPPSDSGKA